MSSSLPGTPDGAVTTSTGPRLCLSTVDYINRLMEVPGWTARSTLFLTACLLEAQDREGVHGDLLEIGLYQGRFFGLLGKYRHAEERLVGVETFDLAPRETLDTNLASLGLVREERTILAKRSVEIAPADLTEGRRTFRFASIDGSHRLGDVLHDLGLVAVIGNDQFIVSLDDFFHPNYPGVTEALFRAAMFRGLRKKLVPFALCGGRLFLCAPQRYDACTTVTEDFIRAHAAELPLIPPPAWSRKQLWIRQPLLGHGIYVLRETGET